MNKKRELYSDILKLLSIFLVVVIHVIALYRDKYFYTNVKYYTVLTFIDSFTRVAVPIFFMITGTFMLSRQTEKYSSYLKKRIPKLLIPFFLISIFYYIYECNKVGNSLHVIDFITAFLNNEIKYHFWFMYAIILIYLLIPYIQILVQNLDRKKLFSLIILIFVLSNCFNTIYLLTNRYGYGMLKAFVLPSLFSYINCLLIGHYLHTYKIEKKKKIILLILSILCICIMPIADHFFINGARNDEMLLVTSVFPIIPAISTYLLFKDFFENRKESKITKFMSKFTPCVLYIYMIHVYIIEKLEKDLYKYWTPNRFVGNLARLVIVIIISFIVSLLISYLLVIIQNLIIKLKRKIKIKK